MIGLFDHAYGFAPEGRLIEALAVWRAAGFAVRDDCIGHRGGKLSGFAMMTGSYLELIAVTDERAFAVQATAVEHAQRARGGPYALAAACRDAATVRNRLRETVPGIGPVDLRPVESEIDGSPAWAMVELPAPVTPGASVSIIEYLRRGDDWATPTCGINGVYGVGGYFFCSERGAQAAAVWKTTFAPAVDDLRQDGARLRCGHQTLTWLSATEHMSLFGDRPTATDLEAERLCAIGLLSVSVDRTAEAFAAAGMAVRALGDGRLAAALDPRTGYAFIVEPGPGAGDLAAQVNLRLAR